MTTTSHDIGDKRRLAITFKDFADVDADPTNVLFELTEPDGTVISYTYPADPEVVKDAVGKYYVDFLFTKQGRHNMRFTGTGAIESAEATDIFIRAKR